MVVLIGPEATGPPTEGTPMSTVSITRRPIPMAAAAGVAAAVLAFAGVAVAQHDSGSGGSGSSGHQGAQSQPHHRTFPPTMSGGRTQLSLP
jgi:hypothetical protein